MISSAEFDEIAGEIEDELLIGTGLVLTFTSVSDGAGAKDESYAAGDELACAIAPVGGAGQARLIGGRVSESSTHVVTLPRGTAITTKDRVEIEAVVYSVTGLRNFGEWSMTRRVEVKVL